MEKTFMKQKDLRKIIRETIEKEEPKTYYVANSSYFDSNSYCYRNVSLRPTASCLGLMPAVI